MPKANPPKNSKDWKDLIKNAIERAERTNDRRVAGLRRALVAGNVESHLRKLGIICPEDLQREFPEES